MKKYLVIAAALLLASSAFAKKNWTATVSYVSDGDTVWVQLGPANKPRKVRMVGIDAPESCQTGGQMARDFLAGRVMGRQVMLTTYGKDDYGRALGRIYLNGEDIGAWMVRSGYAWSYHTKRGLGPYAAEELQAQAARRGVFASGSAENPRAFRKRHGSCHSPQPGR